MHALGFHVAEDALGSLTIGPNVQLGAQIVQANMVLSALCTELFFKCLVCIETGLTPQGHHLSDLFEQVTPTSKKTICHLWDTQIVPARDAHWKIIETSLRKAAPQRGEVLFKRDLPSALAAANRAFERIRYSYEPESINYSFYIGDMPRVMRRVILAMKPEWKNLGRGVAKVSDAPGP